jgi:type II secretory pathway pseudopilin PulG
MGRKTVEGRRKTRTRASLSSTVCRLPSSESGYTLVAIVIGMAVMAILMMAVAPSIATIMKREREQELLFRGKQYARAIALFQRRYGRFPTELKQLYENRPRTIRQLWKDPMCNCPDWQPLYQGSPDALPPGAQVGPPGTAPATPAGRPQPTPTPGVFGAEGQTKSVGPIIGVRSKVHEEALSEWRGQKFYDEWRFIMGDADRSTVGIAPIQGAPPSGLVFPMPTPVVKP